jgi:multiple sugar transport system permease protein
LSAVSPRRPQLDAGYDQGFADRDGNAGAWGTPAPPLSLIERLLENRANYLAAALCLALATIMLLPLLASVLASFKSTAEAAAVPPTYFPHVLSLDSYNRLWHFQAGLPTYLANSGGAALLTILFCLVLTIPAGYGLARFPVPGKEFFFLVLLLGLIVPYQALLTPLFFMFVQLKLHNSLVGLAIVHTAIQLPFSVYIMRNAFEAVPRELEEAAVIDGCNSWQVLVRVFLPAIVPAVITVALFAFITSWNELLAALVILNKDSTFTLPLILAAARQQTSIGGTDWGMLQAGITISILPCMAFYLLLQKYYVSGLLSGAVK